jgi:RNA polymerase sigma-70 factor (ECF subfamily)
MTDKTLIEELRAGNATALRDFVDRYQPLILQTARGFVRNSEDARDITQDVFLDVMTNLNRFRGQSGLSTWIYRITINRSLNFIRSQKNRSALVGMKSDESGAIHDPAIHLSDPTQKNPVELLEQQDRSRILHAALESLPKNQRIAITLAEYDDLSYLEISEVMNVTVSSVESLIFRARKNLQKKLWNCYKKSC